MVIITAQVVADLLWMGVTTQQHTVRHSRTHDKLVLTLCRYQLQRVCPKRAHRCST
jgi:hypothetical protein